MCIAPILHLPLENLLSNVVFGIELTSVDVWTNVSCSCVLLQCSPLRIDNVSRPLAQSSLVNLSMIGGTAVSVVLACLADALDLIIHLLFLALFRISLSRK